MKNNVIVPKMTLRNFGEIFLIWLIIFWSMFLRAYKADYFPIHNNDDSLFHVWAGTSSLKNFLKPASLSIFTENNKAIFWYSQYNHFDILRQFSFRLEQPYFDQPPLAMFFIALPAKIFGFTDFVQVPQMLVRIPSLLICVFSLYFTFILAKKLFNHKVAIFSLLTYGLTPFYIFAQRQSYLENFLVPLLLLTLINLLSFLEKPTKLNFALLIFISLVAGWIKIVGFGIFLIITFWLLKKKKIKAGLIIALIGIISFAGYLFYGLLIDWEQFKFILFTQSQRGMYLSSFIDIFTKPEFYEPFKDGFYFLNFIIMFAFIIKGGEDEKKAFLSLNFIFWLLLIILTSGINNNSPWYRYPLFPFLSIAAGYYLNSFLQKPDIILVMPLVLFGFTGIELLKILPLSNINVLRSFYILFIIPFILKFIYHTSKYLNFICKAIAIILVILIFAINSLVPLRFLTKRCQNSNCLIPDKIVVDFSK